MQSHRQDFVLGLVVLALLGLLVGTVLFIYPQLGVETRTIEVRFRHEEGVAPVKPGSAVMLGGALQVGKVVDVTMKTDDVPGADGTPVKDLMIYVTAEIDADLPLYRNCRITTEQPPVGGGGILLILDAGQPDDPQQPQKFLATSPIDGLPPTGLSAAIREIKQRLMGPGGMVEKLENMLDQQRPGSLAYKISASLSDINAITQSLRSELTPGDQQALLADLHQIVDNINAATASLRQQLSQDQDARTVMTRVHAVLAALESSLRQANAILEENRGPLGQTMQHVASITEQLDTELVANLKREFNADDPGSLLGKVHVALDRLNASLENVQVMTGEGRRMVVLNRPLLDRAIRNLKQASERANQLMLDILLHPWRLFRPGEADIRKHDTFVAAQFFAEAAVELNDAVARLEALSQAAGPGGEVSADADELRAIRQSLQQTFERFHRAESFFFDEMK